MAQSMTLNKPETITIGTTLTELTGATARAKWLVITESADTLYLVTDSSVADGAAVPTDREPIAATALPVAIDISGYGKVLLAQASSGTATIRVAL